MLIVIAIFAIVLGLILFDIWPDLSFTIRILGVKRGFITLTGVALSVILFVGLILMTLPLIN